LIWLEAQGIWAYDVIKANVHQVLTDTIQISDPKGDRSAVRVSYQGLTWSPDSRFVAIRIIVAGSDVSWYSLVDVLNKRLGSIPDTYETGDSLLRLGWTWNGNLILAQGISGSPQATAHIKLWQITPSRRDFLLLTANLAVTYPTNATAGMNAPLVYSLDWPTQISDRLLGLGICQPGSPTAPLLLTLDTQNGSVRPVTLLPPDTKQVLWAPDASGALVVTPSQVFFAPIEGRGLRDLLPTLGITAQQFTWLPYLP
jgi:hypothetical protein